MNYEEFKKELVDALSKKYGDGSITISTTLLNGKETETLEVKSINQSSSCTIRPLYNMYVQRKLSIEYFISMIEYALSNVDNPMLVHPGRILYRLINQKDNEELLSRVPYMPFYDMAVTFVYQVDNDMESNTYLIITNDIMKENNLTFEQLMNYAYDNTQKMYPWQVNLLATNIFENLYSNPSSRIESFINLAITAFESRAEHRVPTYVVKSFDYRFGCSALLYSEYLETLATALNKSLIVIPKNEAEFYVLPYYENADKKEIKHLIENEDSTECKRISEYILFFDKDTQKLTVFGENE